MNINECKEYIKDFFDKYYAKFDNEDGDMELILPDIDERMQANDADSAEEWRKWKLIPSDVSEEELDKLEENIGIKMPTILRAFLSTYFHYFDNPIGKNSIDEKFFGINNAWNPMLVKFGYLPFAWDEEGYCIRCINTNNMPEEDKCEVCQIDHEVMFDFDEDSVTKEDIEENMNYIADNFCDYLNKVLDGEFICEYDEDEDEDED